MLLALANLSVGFGHLAPWDKFYETLPQNFQCKVTLKAMGIIKIRAHVMWSQGGHNFDNDHIQGWCYMV